MKKITQIALVAIMVQVCLRAELWEKASDMPVPVYGAKAVILDNLIYIIGGYSSIQDSALTNIQQFNPVNNIWIEAYDSLFAPRYGLNAHIYMDSLYVFGGVFGGPFYLTWGLEKHSFKFDPVIYSYNYNFNRFNAASVIKQDILYIFGGDPDYDYIEIDSPLKYLAKYDIPNKAGDDSCFVNSTFRDSDFLPAQQMAVLMGENVYLFGGKYNGIMDDIYRYDIVKDTLLAISKLKRERAGGAAVALDNDNIFIIAGKDGEDRAMRETEIYQVSSNTLYDGPSLLKSRGEITAVLWGDTIFVFGGIDNNGNAVALVEKISVTETKSYISGVTKSPAFQPELYSADKIRLLNVPNPFNSSTTIQFNLAAVSKVYLAIYSITGQLIRILENNTIASGEHQYTWNGNNNREQAVPSGIYFCRLLTGKMAVTRKLILIK